jgi:N-methylhydantoinase A/oxoprolinase/acetone carboxylase beta subunit
VLAACAAAVAAGFPDAVTFDMGGTSTDVCLIRDGRPQPAAQRTVAGFPIRMPSLDVHTIGAGGGSIAGIDPGGALVVGPASAGADPGPVCYGRGGDQATVTDADLLAGRIPADGGLPGLDRLDVKAAQWVLDSAGLTAAGIIDVVDANMVRAVRRVSVERGVDPRGLALVAFGGAGPLHACALADALGMSAVVVPARAGVLSAAGILTGPRQIDVVRGWTDPKDLTGAEHAVAGLAVETGNRLSVEGEDPTVETALDCRYAGQSHELTVATVADFEAEHRRRNGFARPGAPIEVVALRASARLRSPVSLMDLPDPGGRAGPRRGPAVIAEPDCTIWVPQGWTADVGGGGAWVLTRQSC